MIGDQITLTMLMDYFLYWLGNWDWVLIPIGGVLAFWVLWDAIIRVVDGSGN